MKLTLDNLNAEVERIILARLPRLLLDIQLERHTRTGLRPDCGCDYCVAKNQATARVMHCINDTSFQVAKKIDEVGHGHRHIRSYGSCQLKYTDEWLIKQDIRERVRKEERAKLEAIKNG